MVSLLSGCAGSDDKKDEPALTAFCSDGCSHAHDGVCDDGRPGATYSECKFGTDCADCGVRYGPASYSNQPPAYSNGYSNGYSNSYSNSYSNYSNTYSNYSNYYSNYSNYYSNYSNYSNSSYYNYYNYTTYYNYFVNSW